ncbi:hypothetical protein EB796_023721 [Bugula neritina]|uniref:Uncharacterized protein n=1 Tax=Bugula neritina TaxID=10212 RepID=A0A7J7IX12_BUGNE|nr:hypothetical protein EB796_023721 [Bugula neritina]
MESSDGGPIMFVEDGETYMLVPKRKTRPLSVDKSTQTARNCGPYRSHGNNNNKQNGRSQLNCGSDCTGIEIRISQNNE